MLRKILIAFLFLAGQAHGDGTLTIGLRGPILHRDPQLATSPDERMLARARFRSLMQDDPTGKPIPDLALGIDLRDGGLTHLVRLRDATWSDGAAITAADVVFGFRRLADPKLASPYRHLLADMALANADAVLAGDAPPDRLGIAAPAPDRVVLTTDRPVPELAALLAHPALAPLPAHVSDHAKVTSGPYQEDTPTPNGLTLQLSRTANAEPEAPETIRMRTPTDWSAATEAFAAGEYDILPLPGAHLAAARERFGRAAVPVPLACTWGYVVNMTETAPPALRDPAIRRALSLALDRQQIIDTILGDGQQPASGWVPPYLAGFTPPLTPDAQRPQSERSAEAARIMAEAGHDADHPLLLRVVGHTGADARRLLDALQHYWRPLNVIVRAEETGWDAYQRRVSAGDFGLAGFGWCGDANDATAFQAVLGAEGRNPGGFDNPDYRALLDLASMRTGRIRAGAQTAASALLGQENPMIPIFHYAAPVLVSPRVGGFAPDNPMGRLDLGDIRLLPDAGR